MTCWLIVEVCTLCVLLFTLVALFRTTLLHFSRLAVRGKDLSASHHVVVREKLLIASAVSRSHSLLITHRHKHKSSSLTS